MLSKRSFVRTCVGAVAVAGALSLILATRVVVGFDGQRVKLVKAPVLTEHGQLRIDTSIDARVANLAMPIALIAILQNTGAEPLPFELDIDGTETCAGVVGAGRTQRIDCVISRGWRAGVDHRIDVRGASDTWSLDYLEVATHHGASTRFLPFVIFPELTRDYRRPPLWLVVMMWGLLTLLGMVWSLTTTATWRPWGRWGYWLGGGAAGMALLAVAVAPWVSSYRVLLLPGTFAKLAALMFAPSLWCIGAEGVTQLTVLSGRLRGDSLVRRWWASATVGLLVSAGFGAAVWQARPTDGNVSGLLHVSRLGFETSPLMAGRADIRDTLALSPDEGYDGQFMYFATFDPMMRRYHDDPAQYRKVADAAPYRFGRIGFPWLVRLVAGARWQWYPWTMLGLVVVGAGLTAMGIARYSEGVGAAPWWGLAVLAIPGFWQSMRTGLPEPVAAAFLVWGYLAVVRRRVGWAVVLFAVSLLVRETGVLFVLAVAGWGVVKWKERLVVSASLVPLVCWRLYVASTLWTDWGWSGLIYSPHTIGVPLAGIAALWAQVAAGTYHPGVGELARAAVWFPVVLGIVSLTALHLTRFSARDLGIALVAYAGVALCLSYPMVWGHVGNAERVSFEVFLMVILAGVRLVGVRAGPPATPSLWLRPSLVVCWCVAVAYVLLASHDALATRQALTPWN